MWFNGIPERPLGQRICVSEWTNKAAWACTPVCACLHHGSPMTASVVIQGTSPHSLQLPQRLPMHDAHWVDAIL